MKTAGIVLVVLLLGTPAAHGGSAAPGQASKPGGGPSASSTAARPGPSGGSVSTLGGPSASSKAGKQGPGGGKGSSAIDGTKIGAWH